MEYAAHIRTTNQEVQTVEEHCSSAAELAEKYTKKLSLSALGRLVGFLHDSGKMNCDFNGYIHNEKNFRRGEIDHCFAGAKYLCEFADKCGNENVKETARFAARVIMSHHGLQDWLREDGGSYFHERISKDERYEEIRRNLNGLYDEEKLKSMLEAAAEEYVAVRNKIITLSRSCCQLSKNSNGMKTVTFYLGMFERFMESVLIDADRTDTADFMSGCKTEREYDTDALWEEMHIRMTEKQRHFENKTDRISQRRQSISRRCAEYADHKARVCRLNVPTGGGKTLSSLRYAIDCARNYHMDKIIYVAPFMSILEQNSDEISAIAGRENFLEHYSDVLQQIEDEKELSEYELRTEKWDSPVIATTMVQFFNTLFLGKSSSVRRMHRLSNAVIIIDEVQSVPLKCVYLFNMAVNFLSHICGSTVVLCSATQSVFEKTDYPVLLDEDPDMTGDYTDDFEAFRRTELTPMLRMEGYTYEQAADFCYGKFLENSNLLAVVNTKTSAAAIYKLIRERNHGESDEGKAEIIHLSTNMCPQHRKEKIRHIRELLENKRSVICVTTQLIEAGVDISFGCVVRSLAGMDNAAQAAGRCNRNGESEGVKPVYIINIRDEKLGNLEELKSAQSISERLINSRQFQNLLSDGAMSVYFRKLYNEQKKKLSYPIKGTNDDMIDLLSADAERQVIKKNPETAFCAQAFKTAGNNFKMIDNETEDIIVPYDDEARRIIERLNSDITPKEALDELRKAQRYTVDVHSGRLLCLRCGKAC